MLHNTTKSHFWWFKKNYLQITKCKNPSSKHRKIWNNTRCVNKKLWSTKIATKKLHNVLKSQIINSDLESHNQFSKSIQGIYLWKQLNVQKFFLKLSCFCIPLNQIYFKCESKVSIACEHFGAIGYRILCWRSCGGQLGNDTVGLNIEIDNME